MTNVEALAVTLGELRRTGRVERIDAAHVQALESMAAVLDADPSNAALWRQYRDALGELTHDGDGGSVDAELAELFGPVRNSPSI